MVKIKIFGKVECAKCQTTKNKLTHLLEKWNYNNMATLEFFDMDTVEGMAEGAYYDVLKVPTTVIENDEITIGRWEGEIPNTEDVKKRFEGVMQKI